MSFSADLRTATAPDWDAAIDHRFVHELWAGTVQDAVLAGYLTQDHQFLDAFVALLGAAVASADEPAPRLAIARQLGLVEGEENDYFTRALDRLGVTEDDRRAPVLTDPTRGFLDLMGEATRSADYGMMLAVLVVAEWLYLDWADRPQAPAPSDWLHREWIDLHRGEAFARWVGLLRDELDRVAEATDHTGRARITAAFTRAVALERAFFDASY